MGPSGSGKSTAMNIIGCLDTPTSGPLRLSSDVDAGRLDRGSRATLRNLYIGFVFQGYNLLPRTTAAENVELPLIYRGVPARERRELAMQALAEVGLEGRENHTPAELSGGQQQRVAIARAIVTRPTLLVADEPTGNLDTARSHEIMDLLTRLNEDLGLTIVMVTHEADIAAYAERTIGFLDGNVASDTLNAGGGVMLWETVRLALLSVRRNVLRSFLTLLGIVIGVAAVIAMITIGSGTTEKVHRRHLQARQQPAGRARRAARPLRLDLLHAAHSSTSKRRRRPCAKGLTDAKAVSAAAQKQVRVVYGAAERRRRGHRHRHRLFRRARLGRRARAACSPNPRCAAAPASASSARPCAASSSAPATRRARRSASTA